MADAHFISESDRARFLSKVDRRGLDDCWPWKGARNGRGYGQFYIDRRRRKASQVAWEVVHGRAFPVGKMACHTCDNPPCVNPAHIWAGTMSQDLLDASRKNRVYRPHPGFRPAQTHCQRGHEFTPENTIRNARLGKRKCRECNRARDRASYRLRMAKTADLDRLLLGETETQG